jgi:hypothetical protein
MRVRSRIIKPFLNAGAAPPVFNILDTTPRVYVDHDNFIVDPVGSVLSEPEGIEFVAAFESRKLELFTNYNGKGNFIGTSSNATKFLRLQSKSMFKFLHNGSPFTVAGVFEGKIGTSYANGLLSTMYNTGGTNGFILYRGVRLYIRNNSQLITLGGISDNHEGVVLVSCGMTADQTLWLQINNSYWSINASGFTYQDTDSNYGLAIGRTEGNSRFKAGSFGIWDRELSSSELENVRGFLQNKHNIIL